MRRFRRSRRFRRKNVIYALFYLVGLVFRLLFWLIRLPFGLSRPRKILNSGGYVVEKSESGREQLEHRKVAEEVLGRTLYHWEVVHHINGRRSDNRPENLCVMSRNDHNRYHNWYSWIADNFGKYPRRETQLRKLREEFGGTLLMDLVAERIRKV